MKRTVDPCVGVNEERESRSGQYILSCRTKRDFELFYISTPSARVLSQWINMHVIHALPANRSVSTSGKIPKWWSANMSGSFVEVEVSTMTASGPIKHLSPRVDPTMVVLQRRQDRRLLTMWGNAPRLTIFLVVVNAGKFDQGPWVVITRYLGMLSRVAQMHTPSAWRCGSANAISSFHRWSWYN